MSKHSPSRQAEFWSDEGNRHLRSNDPFMAKVSYENALAQQPNNPMYLKQAANLLIHFKEFGKALDYYAAARDPEGAGEALGEWKKHIYSLLAQKKPYDADKEFKQRAPYIAYWQHYQLPPEAPANFPAQIRAGRDVAPQRAPENTHNRAGCAHFERGDFEQALACFSRALEEAPYSPIFHLNKIDSLNELHRYPEALAAAGVHPSPLRGRIEKSKTLSLWEAHITQLSKTEQSEETIAQLELLTAYAYAGADDRSKAKAIVANLNGQLNYDAQLYAAALPFFETATQLAPTNKAYHRSRIDTLNKCHRFAEAVNYCASFGDSVEAQIKKNATLTLWDQQLHQLIKDSKNEETTAEATLLADYVTRHPDDKIARAVIANARGHAHYYAENYEAALESYAAASANNPMINNSHNKINTLEQLFRYKEALDLCPKLGKEDARRKEEKLLNQWEGYIDTQFRENNIGLAQAEYGQLADYASEGKPKANAVLAAICGHLRYTEGYLEEALACYNQAIEHYPSDLLYHKYKVETLTHLDRHTEALKASDIFPENEKLPLKTAIILHWAKQIEQHPNLLAALAEKRALQGYAQQLPASQRKLKSTIDYTLTQITPTAAAPHTQRLMGQRARSKSAER